MIIISTCEHKLHELEFVKPLTDIFPDAKTVHYKDLVDEQKNVDTIIISGTSLKDEEYLKHLNKFDWIKTSKSNIIGICAGAQIIAKLHWGDLTYGKEIGTITVIGKDPFPESFEAYALHKNSIELSSDFEILAHNDKVQAFKIDKKTGLLFHPEVRNKDLLKKLI